MTQKGAVRIAAMAIQEPESVPRKETAAPKTAQIHQRSQKRRLRLSGIGV